MSTPSASPDARRVGCLSAIGAALVIIATAVIGGLLYLSQFRCRGGYGMPSCDYSGVAAAIGFPIALGLLGAAAAALLIRLLTGRRPGQHQLTIWSGAALGVAIAVWLLLWHRPWA